MQCMRRAWASPCQSRPKAWPHWNNAHKQFHYLLWPSDDRNLTNTQSNRRRQRAREQPRRERDLLDCREAYGLEPEHDIDFLQPLAISASESSLLRQGVELPRARSRKLLLDCLRRVENADISASGLKESVHVLRSSEVGERDGELLRSSERHRNGVGLPKRPQRYDDHGLPIQGVRDCTHAALLRSFEPARVSVDGCLQSGLHGGVE